MSRQVSMQFGSPSIVNRNGGSDSFPELKVFEVEVIDNLSVSASGYAEISYDISIPGYKPLSVAGYRFENASSSGTGSSYFYAYRSYINTTDQFIMSVRNSRSSAAKIKIILYVLCQSL